MANIRQCSVCGGNEFVFRRVLQLQLIADWELSLQEVLHIDRQQGEACTQCGTNLRSIALANAIRSFVGFNASLRAFVQSVHAERWSILELNEAGTLHATLRVSPHYTFGAYPQVDMKALPYKDGTFDIVVHSDTLEHIDDADLALSECFRVLKPDGALCFTVPIIVGRVSRSRSGMPKSYHYGGNPEDYLVHNEFGSDTWTRVARAGFSVITIHTVCYPCALAFCARKHDNSVGL